MVIKCTMPLFPWWYRLGSLLLAAAATVEGSGGDWKAHRHGPASKPGLMREPKRTDLPQECPLLKTDTVKFIVAGTIGFPFSVV